MIGRASSFLGLAFNDRGIACAEVAVSGDRRTVRRMATFVFTADHALEKPEATGAALAAFLREKRFTSSRAVAGVPARWLLASEKDLPPADKQQARAALQLHAERVAVGDSGGDVVFDYAGEANPQAASRVLLVGITRPALDRVQKILDSAGLSVAGITSIGLVIADAVSEADRDAGLLLVGRAGAEMILRQSDGNPRVLRHVAVSANGHGAPALAPLGAEIRRAVAMTNGTGPLREMLLLDGVGFDPNQINELSTKAGIPLRDGDELKILGVSAESFSSAQSPAEKSEPIGFYFAAAALAIAGAQSDELPIDFSKSRLAPAKARRLSRNAVVGIIAAIVAIAGISVLYSKVSQQQAVLDDVREQIRKQEERTKPAATLVERVTIARGYYDLRPKALESLRQLTSAFHDEDKIWVTSWNIHDNGKGTLQGKAADNETVLLLVDRLKKNPKFTTVQLTDSHPGDARTQEFIWSLNFTYNFAE
jgi:hypothetical protein